MKSFIDLGRESGEKVNCTCVELLFSSLYLVGKLSDGN